MRSRRFFYLRISSSDEAENEKLRINALEARRKSLTSKYGSVDAEMNMDRQVWIGMTQEQAVESWGRPILMFPRFDGQY